MTVISEPDSVQCRRKTAGDAVQFVCEVKYTGWIQPTIQWLVEDKEDEPINGTLHATGQTLQSRLNVSATAPSSWPTKCRITFHRQSCNEPRVAYVRTPECSSDDGIMDVVSLLQLPISLKLIIILLINALQLFSYSVYW